MKMFETKIKNSEGTGGILLNEREYRVAKHLSRQMNALGYNVDITMLTAVSKKVITQKFFEITPSDYLNISVGDGAWMSETLQYVESMIGDDFSTGFIDTGSNNARQAMVDSSLEAVKNPLIKWAKTITWALPELEIASRGLNWDIVTAKEKARKKNWDLGIQRAAFVGVGAFGGLLNQAGVVNNTTLITEPLSGMTSAELSTFLAGVLGAYRANAAYTAWPTHFVIPESDYLGLAVPTSDTFPLKSKLSLIEETFQIMTKNPSFKVLPMAYADALGGVQRYALYNGADAESLRMEIPVDYTNTAANSINGFHFQNVGYGQFGPVKTYRPKEMLYFSYNTP